MREALKATARGVAFLLVLPSLASYAIREMLLGRDRALQGSTEFLSRFPGITGQYLRRAFLARAIARCAPSVVVGFGTIFSKAGASLDTDVYIGPACHIGLVHIEPSVLIGAGVHITSGRHTHGTSTPGTLIRDQPGEARVVRIGTGAWIGSAAVVMADVGAHSVIGAGSVVVDPIPASVVAAGVPARVIRARTPAGDHEVSASRA
jgi:acetyltransferase-like isoleucine patch superfamily enzyme